MLDRGRRVGEGLTTLGGSCGAFPWQHTPAVFGSLALCVALALWAAVKQFHREGVLFRESQGGGRKWSLFGKK